MMRPHAYILAGGRSRRFGADKAQAALDGKPLILHARDALTPVARSVTVVADQLDRFTSLGLRTIADETPRLGPLGGLATALADLQGRRGGSWAVVTACDRLVLEPGLWTTLLKALPEAEGRGAQAVALRDDRWQPFPGLYSAALLPPVRTQLAQGLRSLAPLLDAHALAAPVRAGALLDVNTPADLDRAAVALHRKGAACR